MKNKIFSKALALSIVTLLSCCSKQVVKAESTLLRSPEGKDHSYSLTAIYDTEYVAFKAKLQSFASSFSEAFATKQFKDGTNFTCSPLSIELCLGLAIRSANGETRQEILDALGVDYETFNKYYKLYYNNLTLEAKNNSDELMAQILLSNSIWMNNTLSIVDSGLDALRDDYYCYSYQVDFVNKNKESCKAIQEFINEQTKGLINPDIQLSTDTLFVLMNTLYLKDIWNEMGSDLSYNNKYHFTNSNGQVSSKQLLQGYYTNGKALQTEDYSAFHTNTRNMSIHFIKPNDGKDIRQVFNKTNIDYVLDRNNYTYRDDEKREEYYTSCVFPEFKANSDSNILDILYNQYNIKSLFNPEKCDCSGITTDKAYCNEVRHIATLEVNKKGIEGAAVTYMAYPGAGAGGELDPYKKVYETFPVDKEFGFILTYSNAIVFSGIVTNIDK